MRDGKALTVAVPTKTELRSAMLAALRAQSAAEADALVDAARQVAAAEESLVKAHQAYVAKLDAYRALWQAASRATGGTDAMAAAGMPRPPRSRGLRFRPLFVKW